MNKAKLFLIFVIGFLYVITPIKAGAGDYLGDYCWNFSNQTFGGSGTLKLGVVHLGGGHYLCSGLITVTDPIFMQFPAYGNAEVVGGEIYMTLSLAGIRNDVMGIDMMKARLNPINLSGPFEYIGVYVDDVEHSVGTVTYTACQ